MTHPMLEKVARAMVSRQFNEWDELDCGDHGYWLQMADAAVKALAEPDQAMIDAGLYHGRRNMPLRDQYKAMIETITEVNR